MLIGKAALANAGQRGGEPPRVVVHTNPDQLHNAAHHNDNAGPAADQRPPGGSAAPRGVARRDRAGRPASLPVGLASCEQTGPLSPFALGVLSCDAVLERCTVGAFGQILDYGRARRLATPAQRRALAARDGGCVIPGCTALPAWCDAHHIVAVAAGRADRPTESGASSARGITPRSTSAGGSSAADTACPWVIPPKWVDPHQRPVRNQLPDTINTAHRLAQQLHFDDTG